MARAGHRVRGRKRQRSGPVGRSRHRTHGRRSRPGSPPLARPAPPPAFLPQAPPDVLAAACDSAPAESGTQQARFQAARLSARPLSARDGRWRARHELKGTTPMDAEQVAGHAFSRRSALKRTAGVGLLLSQAAIFEQLAVKPARARAATLSASATSSTSFSDIQFNLGSFFNAAQTLNDGGGAVQVQFPPVFALTQPLALNRTRAPPTRPPSPPP
jgi:hypothetical protein